MIKTHYDKYKEIIRKQPVRVSEKKWVHLEQFDAPEFIYKHINGAVLKASALNFDWCMGVYKNLLQYDTEDPTKTLIFEQYGQLFIDTTNAFEYSVMKLRDYLAMVYEEDHVFFKRKCRNLTTKGKNK